MPQQHAMKKERCPSGPSSAIMLLTYWNQILVTMPGLQYPNPNKPFKLFTNASKHSYSGILHQEEVSDQLEAEPNLVPVVYFSSTFSKTQQLWDTTQNECYAVYWSIQKFSFNRAGTNCTLYCDHKPLAPFFTTGMFSQVVDHWALELQQFDIQFKYISDKRNVVADAISWLRTLGLYQDNSSDNIVATKDNVVKNVMEEVHTIKLVPNSPSYNMGKPNFRCSVRGAVKRQVLYQQSEIHENERRPEFHAWRK